MFIGGTKAAEMYRSAEMFEEICQRDADGPYFALSLLIDSGYQREDLKLVRNELEKRLKARRRKA